MGIDFDPVKNRMNIREDQIDLSEVEGVFFDDMAITVEDRDHDEQRFVTMGMDGFGRVLVVCYTWRNDVTIRVISAHKA